MSCLHPIEAWQSSKLSESGRRLPTFSIKDAFLDLPKMLLPCGKCESCVTVKQRAWAVRMYHEASLHEQNCMATVTYDQEHVPDAIIPKHSSDFIKRLRYHARPEPVRYFAAGEYGTLYGRPHFHFAFFGSDFLGGGQKVGDNTYRSPFLEKVWKQGQVVVNPLTIESCMYIAGYCLKKADDPFAWSSPSKSPPIGMGWTSKYLKDIKSAGAVIINGKKVAIPKQYFDWYPDELESLKDQRREYALEYSKLDPWERKRQAANQQAYRAARNEHKAARKRGRS